MRIKSLGLALIAAAALAVTAGAASASASGFSAFAEGTGAEHYPATISGKLKSGTNSTLSWGGWGVGICTPGTMSGSLAGPDKSLSVAPNCGTQIQFNGCEVTVNSGAETSPGVYAATVDLGGAKCAGVSIQTEGTSLKCYGTIAPQSGITGSSVSTVEGSPDEVELSLNASFKGTGGGGALGCPKVGQETTGFWSGTWRLSAKSTGGVTRDLRVQSTIATGIAFEEEQFVAETYPVNIAGEQAVSSVQFQAGPGFGTVTCGKAQFGSSLASAASSLTAVATYSSCADSLGRPVAVSMKSCSYVLEGSGGLGVSCGTPGDAIEYQVKNGGGSTVCTATVPAQSGSSGMSYATSGAGYAATIQATANVKSLTTVTSGGLLNCGTKNGTHTDGSFTGGIKLVGSSEYQ